ncbi:MAG: 30S ribosomal protein S3 [Actinomycetota bacterium]
MGQKVNPFGFRLGIINDWRTRWYSEKNYASYLAEDIRIRRHLTDKLFRAGISKIEIERTEQQVKIIIYASRPGIVIGKKGAEVDKLRADLEAMTGKRIRIDIQEVVSPEADAKLIAENVAQQLESRFSFRRAMKKAVQAAMSSGVKGIRISSAGRLGGTEMARTEWYREGQVPLHTLRADIDYGIAEANTKSGKIGVKVWIYKGEVLPEKEIKEEKLEEKERVPEKKEKAAAKETKVAEKTKLAEETKIVEETTEKVSVKEEIEEKGEPGAASKKG